MAILKKKGMPKAKEYKKFLRGMRAATSSKFPADSFMERRMKLGSAKLLAHNKYKLEQPKSALKEVGKKAGRFLPKKVVAVATAIGAGVAALKAKKKKEAKKKMGGGMMKKYTKGGIPGYNTGKGIELAKKHKKTLKDKIATGIGYAGEMGKSIPSPGNPYFIKDQAKKIIEKIKKKRLEKSIKQKQQATREITDIFSGGRKGKPHSSPEGRKASAGRTIRRMIANRKKFMRPNWTTSRNPRALNVGGSVTVKTKIGKYFPTKTY